MDLIPADIESRVSALENEFDELRDLFNRVNTRVSDIGERLQLFIERQDEDSRITRATERKVAKILDILECKTCKRHRPRSKGTA